MKKGLQYIAVEIVIIVIGLLVAFQIDRWYEGYKENKLERKVLKEIKSSLEFDLIDLKSNQYGHEFYLSRIDTLFKYIYTNDERLFQELKHFFRDYTYTPNRSAFDNLKNHDISIISNDSLRIRLSQVYEFDYINLIKLEEQYAPKQFFDRYYKILIDIYDLKVNFHGGKITERDFKLTPKDLSKLRNNSELNILLVLSISERAFVKQNYDYTITKVEKLIKEIEEELNL